MCFFLFSQSLPVTFTPSLFWDFWFRNQAHFEFLAFLVDEFLGLFHLLCFSHLPVGLVLLMDRVILKNNQCG